MKTRTRSRARPATGKGTAESSRDGRGWDYQRHYAEATAVYAKYHELKFQLKYTAATRDEKTSLARRMEQLQDRIGELDDEFKSFAMGLFTERILSCEEQRELWSLKDDSLKDLWRRYRDEQWARDALTIENPIA